MQALAPLSEHHERPSAQLNFQHSCDPLDHKPPQVPLLPLPSASEARGGGRRVFGFRLSAFGFRLLDFGFWILDFGFWILDFGFWILDFGFWILDFGFCGQATVRRKRGVVVINSLISWRSSNVAFDSILRLRVAPDYVVRVSVSRGQD